MRIHTDPTSGLYVNSLVTEVDTDAGTVQRYGQLYTVVYGNTSVTLSFQDGNPAVVGANGMTNEALMLVLLSRLDLQNQAKRCDETESALGHLRVAYANLATRASRVDAEACTVRWQVEQVPE